ncbi:MAG TPA: glycoside hydrolase family 30 beta sandwich domain-containing protein [Puia sp.]|nr:glycoside hydrolase family 30 beta sandwich domain-containing protein [Puia sp.]
MRPENKWKRIGLWHLMLVLLFMSCSKSGRSDSTGTTPPPVDTTTKPVIPVTSDVATWLTNADQSALFAKQNVALNFSTASNGNPTITVDDSKTYQSIDGFGYAMTGGSAYVINHLPADTRHNLLTELFATDSTHIGVSYLRISIGASDLSANVFSYDDMPAGQTDESLSYFSLGPDSYDLIPVLKEVLTINPNIKILGSPWSAPVWMKTNSSTVGGSLNSQYYGVYANYFIKYIQAMATAGITIDAITPQNEPMNPNNNPSMTLTADQEADFVKNHLGPAFDSAGIQTKIIIFDHNCDNPEYPLAILADPDAFKYIDGTAFHLYGGDISALSQIHAAAPSKNVYFTEQWVGAPGDFPNDLNWAVKNLIIGASRNWSRNVLEWNLANDSNYGPHTVGGCTSCLGALTIGSSVTRNVSYYIIAHASKFVRPGSVRIDSNIPGNLQNVAFKTSDGRKVLIVLNDGASAQTFNISYGGKIVTPSLNAGAVATYIW